MRLQDIGWCMAGYLRDRIKERYGESFSAASILMAAANLPMTRKLDDDAALVYWALTRSRELPAAE